MWRGRRVGASAEDGDVGEADPSRVKAAPEETPEAEGRGAAEGAPDKEADPSPAAAGKSLGAGALSAAGGEEGGAEESA